ncbi:MAG: hypothetical protein ACRD0U_19045, partial [Acidimicrobiales bacterium]
LAATTHAIELLDNAAERGIAVDALGQRSRARRLMIEGFVDAYRRYCWAVESVDDLRELQCSSPQCRPGRPSRR